MCKMKETPEGVIIEAVDHEEMDRMHRVREAEDDFNRPEDTYRRRKYLTDDQLKAIRTLVESFIKIVPTEESAPTTNSSTEEESP